MRRQRMLAIHAPQAISGDRPRSFFSSSPFAQSMVLFDGLSRNSVASYSSLPPPTDDDFSPVDVTSTSRFRSNGLARSSSSPFSRSFLPLDRNGFAYSGLPDEPLKLSVRRLDGSSFDVEVQRSATVGNLREAIRDVFSDLPNNNSSNISWKHVWCHFCLCYNGQKLIRETDSIVDFGIRYGDQLHFARHLTIADTLDTTPSKKKAMDRSNTPRAHNRKRSRAGYELISMQDDDFGDIVEGGWKWQADLT